MDEPRIAAAYIRVSTDDQLEYSPDSQLTEIRKYAAAHNLILPSSYIFADDGISGKTTDNRPAFNRMIGTAKCIPRPFDVLLLWKFSRFARNREDAIVYKSILRRQLNIEVVSVSEPIGDDKISIIIEAMIEAMDEYYSINLAEEVRRGMTQRVNTGRPNTYAPFGYRIESGNYITDPYTAPVVGKIYADFLSGKPVRIIAHELSALGIQTRFGNEPDRRFITYILRNPVYIGKVHWTPHKHRNESSPLIVDGDHEPLVSLAAFNAVQLKLEEQKRSYGYHGRQDGKPFLLKGLLKCSCCGGTLVSCGSGYQCHNFSSGRCPESHYLSKKLADTAILQQIKHDLPALYVPVDTIPSENFSQDIPIIEQQLAHARAKLPRIRAAYESGIDSLAEYQANRERIENQIRALQGIAETAPSPPPVSVVTVTETMCTSAYWKNLLLRSFIKGISFDRKNSLLTIHYYL